MLLRWSLTDASFKEVLPSYLCASLLWPAIEACQIAADFLVPISQSFETERRRRRFHYLVGNLTEKERALVGRFLLFFLGRDGGGFEEYFGIPETEIREAIGRWWT